MLLHCPKSKKTMIIIMYKKGRDEITDLEALIKINMFFYIQTIQRNVIKIVSIFCLHVKELISKYIFRSFLPN